MTGASSGIGLAAAAELAASGYQVFGFSRRAGGSAAVTSIAVDVRSEAAIQHAVDRFSPRVGVLMCSSAPPAIPFIGGLEESSASQAEAIFNTNVFGTMRVTRAVFPPCVPLDLDES